jgi:serine kinase of HPr protein (carbohydrate metabolism regulator)
MTARPELVHGTAIAVGGRAALIRGPSGAGKSDLALRCLMQAPSPLLAARAELVADDRAEVRVEGEKLWISAPLAIHGLLEVRGVGILRVPAVAEAELVLIVELVEPEAVERLPAPETTVVMPGHELPCLRLAPFETSASSKLLLALDRGPGCTPGGQP